MHSRAVSMRRASLCLLTGLAVVVGPVPAYAQSASLSKLETMSHKLDGDEELDCAALDAGIAQLDRNVMLIGREMEDGKAAISRHEAAKGRIALDGSIAKVSSHDFDPDVTRDLRWGLRRLVEIERLARWRSEWLSGIRDRRGCANEAVLSNAAQPG